MKRCIVSSGCQDEFNGVAVKVTPTVWLPSMATMAAVLSGSNQSLLRLIRDKGPKSLTVGFAAKQDVAVLFIRTYWQRAGNENKAAIALGKPILELKLARVVVNARYWPIFNLDLKKPNTKAGLEHPDQKRLIASMRSQKVEVMRPLGGIQALMAEV